MQAEQKVPSITKNIANHMVSAFDVPNMHCDATETAIVITLEKSQLTRFKIPSLNMMEDYEKNDG